MTINELIPEIFEESDVDHSISINEYAVDIRIYNAYGLIEFVGFRILLFGKNILKYG